MVGGPSKGQNVRRSRLWCYSPQPGFVSGHDFSRAEIATKNFRASAPAESNENRELSRVIFRRKGHLALKENRGIIQPCDSTVRLLLNFGWTTRGNSHALRDCPRTAIVGPPSRGRRPDLAPFGSSA